MHRNNWNLSTLELATRQSEIVRGIASDSTKRKLESMSITASYGENGINPASAVNGLDKNGKVVITKPMIGFMVPKGAKKALDLNVPFGTSRGFEIARDLTESAKQFANGAERVGMVYTTENNTLSTKALKTTIVKKEGKPDMNQEVVVGENHTLELVVAQTPKASVTPVKPTEKPAAHPRAGHGATSALRKRRGTNSQHAQAANP
ncbi:MAG: hypothetical protein HZA95_04165 [Candidatus Vogelbacteria bacterium]|nr:hypothetical protein [Candidatus Vogelbacteria bacterium]